MKCVWIDNSWSAGSHFVDEVADVLGRDEFNVELFGVGQYDKTLPDNYSIVDYGSRETLAMCKNGCLLDKEEIWLEDCINTILCSSNYDEDFVRELLVTNDELRVAALNGDWDAVFEILSEIENENSEAWEM